jgi:hypothetical protein
VALEPNRWSNANAAHGRQEALWLQRFASAVQWKYIITINYLDK